METYSSSLENGISLANLCEHNVKRACFNWGIGRELYTSPFIWVKAADVEIKESKGRFVTYDKFKVDAITYEGNKIKDLSIVNQKGVLVFATRGSSKAQANPKATPKSKEPEKQKPQEGTVTFEDVLKEGAKHDMLKPEIWNIWKAIFLDKADHQDSKQASRVLKEIQEYGGTPLTP